MDIFRQVEQAKIKEILGIKVNIANFLLSNMLAKKKKIVFRLHNYYFLRKNENSVLVLHRVKC